MMIPKEFQNVWFLLGCCVGCPLALWICVLVEKRFDELPINNSIHTIEQRADNSTDNDTPKKSLELGEP